MLSAAVARTSFPPPRSYTTLWDATTRRRSFSGQLPGRARPYRVPRDQFRIAMVSSWPDALAGPCAPGAPL
jgi:hypothetical protein